MAQVWLYNVPLCPSPLSQLTILIWFSLAWLRPFLTPGPERYHEVQGGAAHVCMVRLAIIWRSPPSGSLYKQPQFYCIFSSSCGVLEV